MKKTLEMIFTILITFTLMVLGIVFCPPSFTQNQLDTLIILLIICGVSILYCFVTGEITRNNSQMDKLWSILPIVYVWVIAIKGWFDIRLIIIACLVTFWGIRLTVNFAKKGAYSIKFWEGEEDYRWQVVRSNKYMKNKFVWAIFDLLFISIYQNLVVLGICLPALVVMNANKDFNWFDIIPTILVLFFIIFELIADDQQMKFYNKRKELMSGGKKLDEIDPPYNKGFNTLGIWKYSRHPNYLCEQSIWVCLYMFVISAGNATYCVFNWSIAPSMLLILIFLGSSNLAEQISSSKYKEYANYIKTTSKYIPWFNRRIK